MAVQQVTSRLIADNSITNAKVASAAGIEYSKLDLTSSIVNADVAAAAAIAYTKLNLSNSITNSDVSPSAAIVYSKLSLSNSIVNADINAAAAIAYSKLDLSSSIDNGDISATADIAYSKLDLTGNIVDADVNAAAAISYSKLNLSNQITNTDINASADIAYSKLDLTGNIVDADINASAAIAYSKLNLTDSIVNADINSAADIDTSKLSLNADFRHPVPTELVNFSGTTSALVQDLSGDIVASVSTGPTVKGVVVLENDTNFVPRGVKNEYSLDDILAVDIDPTITGDDENQSVYMRLTNTYASNQPVNVSGVTIGYMEQGNTTGSLTYAFATTELTWKAGTPVDVSTDGLYALEDGSGNRIIVEVVAGSLPGSNQSDTITTAAGLRGALFYRATADGSEVPLKTPGSLPNPWRLSYPQIYGIDDLPFYAFYGVGNSTDGVVGTHTHLLSDITDVTATASEINQALDGISANVTAANLNTLTGGGNADALHTHAGLGSATNQIDSFTATAGQTVFTLSQTPDADSEHVTIEGVKQAKTTHYTLAGTTLTLTSAANLGERILVQYQY